MKSTEGIKNAVREKYAKLARSAKPATESCCSCCCGDSETDTDVLSPELREGYKGTKGYVPEADLGLGCGIPSANAEIKPGDTVVDLGSGAGNDVFIVRSLVGESGRVIGIDMTQDMIDRAEANNKKMGYPNVEFRLGEIEDLPVEDGSVDVVVSNCVLNLVPDKNKAFSEIFRVLKPGAHFSVSDIVLKGELPGALKRSAEMYTGCIAGASQQQDYLQAVEKAGFTDVDIKSSREIRLPDEALKIYLEQDELEAFKASGTGIFSITVTGRKA